MENFTSITKLLHLIFSENIFPHSSKNKSLKLGF